MARKVEFTFDVDGEETDGFIKLSSSVEKAAITKAFEDDMTPVEALSELTGLDADLLREE